MSISSALSSAMTGLAASSRMAEVTASNVSNALTEGYGRREVQLSARVLGQTGSGVRIDGVARTVDQVVLRDLRLASAAQGYRAPTADFLTRLEQAIGAPDQANSLSGRVTTLERSLLEAAARPESEARLASVVDAARGLTTGLSDLTTQIQTARKTADTQIAADVGTVNQALAGISDLNLRIRTYASTGRETSALMDQRQKLVDQVASIIPVRELARDHDQIALVSTGGTILLDGRPAKLDFSATGTLTADMTLTSGALSGLTVNGQPISTGPEGGRLGEGRLAALFDLRDTLAPAAQAQIDAFSRNLIERLASPTVDPTLAPGDAGLFTDHGAPLDPTDEIGLAGRVSINALVLPEAGGALWRLRDGMGAATAGPSGQSAGLAALGSALTGQTVPTSGSFSPGAHTLSDLATEIASSVSGDRLSAEAELGFAAARSEGLKAELMRDGVDTDQEMQTLLLIEQAYAANAKVIQTAGSLIDILLGISR
ncbi:MAG: flagellar hook-associated protein FlgK [Rhodobacteraceae bacterium]|nr:flagellar hook-associated protein FlgK [Paracoccaceae bacterium]